MSSALSEFERACLGVWNVRRRDGRGDARFLRIAFHPDRRFGALGMDGQSASYGSWRVGAGAAGADEAGHLVLHFDGHGGPSAEFGVAMAYAPAGPLVLTVGASGQQRMILSRAASADAAVVGTWQRVGAPLQRGEYAIDRLDLSRDGTAVVRIAGGIQRAARWEFERTESRSRGPIAGYLTLDPTDVVFPEVRFAATMTCGAACTLSMAMAEREPITLARISLDSVARLLVAHWRLVAPVDVPAPREVTLVADGSVEALRAAGPPRVRGRWAVRDSRRGPNWIEANVAFTVHPHGYPALSDVWPVVLPLRPNAELECRMPGHDATPLRYRRLFR